MTYVCEVWWDRANFLVVPYYVMCIVYRAVECYNITLKSACTCAQRAH